MKKLLNSLSAIALLALSVSSSAACLDNIQLATIQSKIEQLNSSYKDVPSSIQCNRTKNAAEKKICGNKTLAAMEVLDTKAYVYATENATGSEVNHQKWKDDAWIKSTRNRCSTEECICKNLSEHTNDSLGGESPYKK
ncbi:hypothetical protein LIN78_14075 [Leeia sp. TBRC 13508]|uniref:Lipoprotein n=1 Tax=Leeia speluncae TaxID=2884804 RepID=A0ABS8D900_9NEIS|nr:hypothetical protein [Leeia speluncae]MCB6184671.1 hypothetical protein [Leeia speluncae]